MGQCYICRALRSDATRTSQDQGDTRRPPMDMPLARGEHMSVMLSGCALGPLHLRIVPHRHVASSLQLEEEECRELVLVKQAVRMKICTNMKAEAVFCETVLKPEVMPRIHTRNLHLLFHDGMNS